MKHVPFDFCDDCGSRRSMDHLQVLTDHKTTPPTITYHCEACWDGRPDSWRKAKVPKDDYDRITKCGDDQ